MSISGQGIAKRLIASLGNRAGVLWLGIPRKENPYVLFNIVNICVDQFQPLRFGIDRGKMAIWKAFTGGFHGGARIDQIIYVMRDGHKGIVLGNGGETIKAVSTAARVELEEFLDRRVHLFLQIKVRPNWLEEKERYSEMGLDFKDGNI